MMFLKRIAFALTCCVILHSGFSETEALNGKSKEENDKNDAALHDDYTFVALVDIVFTDGSKRTCTGTIIHDNVVITAAHCFCHELETVKPELTASFVVIGTKKMFETGYEQYLPIERILTHPKFRGWTADLALIYTFAGMTSDKPGRVMPIAGEKMSNPVDSNVTVFSWGHCKDNDKKYAIKNTKKPCSDESNEYEQENVRATIGMDSKHFRGGLEQIHLPKKNGDQRKVPQSRFKKRSRLQTDLLRNYPRLQHKAWDKQIEEMPVEYRTGSTTKMLSRYLTSTEDKEAIDQKHVEKVSVSSTFMTQVPNLEGPSIFVRDRVVSTPTTPPNNGQTNYYKNWRRLMGTLQNKLTVEVFGFVNLAACKKIVEGSNSRFEIKTGEVACYSSDEHYVTEEDAGAPAIRHGQLVAVTVGGAQCDGDHVGVGMTMSCYCTWIADNLPGGTNITCCKNCCDPSNNEESMRNMFRNKNKYLAPYE